MDPVAQELIIKMRIKFGDAAATVSAQEIISQEVMTFLSALHVRPSNGAKLKDAEVSVLSDRIRSKLVGGTPAKNNLVTARRALAHDEWLRMAELDAALGEAAAARQREALARQREALKETLAKQMEDIERQKQREREMEEAYWRQEEAALRKAEEEAEARRKLQQEIMMKLRDERLAQVEERVQRREAALARRRVEEALDAARLAHETAEELKREEAARREAKQSLKDFLLQNEENKAIREAEKQKRWAEDAEYQQKWQEQLDRQERERLARLERTKRVQARQEAMAAAQRENSRWQGDDLINKYYKMREDARAEEEERRVARERENARRAAEALAGQLAERQAVKERLRKEDEAYAAAVAVKVKAAEEAERARKAALAEQKAKFRASIEQQMRENAERRRTVPMTDLERTINAKALDKVSTWQSTGRLPELSYSTHV